MDAAADTARALISLSDALLSRFGLDIEDGGRLVRCVVISEEFFVSAHSEEPNLTIYRILQLDDDRDIRQLFGVARHKDSGVIDVRLYREGDWETTYRILATDLIG
jgi:hypothetical protein